jgi:hypothetical protein
LGGAETPTSRLAFYTSGISNKPFAHHQKHGRSLKPGDPLDWSNIIGRGQFIETKPACPVHGDLTSYRRVIPERGTLAAPCQDPEHRPVDIRDW